MSSTATSSTEVHNPGLIVAGMHRSGTSMVASAFGEVGWTLADDLMGPKKANPRGYFEDRALSRLHDRMLAGHGLSWNDVEGLRAARGSRLEILPTHREEARQVVAAYRSGGPWAWKNPRATLFLHAWCKLLPEATVLIVLRQPAGSIDSLIRRGTRLQVPKGARLGRLRQLERAHSLWRSYCFAALNFAKSDPKRVTTVRIPEDLPILQRLAGDAVDLSLLKPASRAARLVAASPSTVRLHRELAAFADPARVAKLLEGPAEQVSQPA